MTDNIKPPAWDVATAWAEWQAARAAGDADAELLAMRRWSEAQTNASIGLVGQIVRPLAEQIANARRADLDWRVEWRDRHDAQADNLSHEFKALDAGQAQIRALVEDSVQDIKKDIGDMGATLSATLTRVDAMEESNHDHTLLLDAHDQRLLAVASRVTSMEGAQQAMEGAQQAMKVEQQAIRRELNRLTADFARNTEEFERLHREHGGAA